MKTESLVGHASELLRIILKSREPSDKLASEYLRARKYIGAKDRRFISELVFRVQRQLSLVEAYAKSEGIDDLAEAGHQFAEKRIREASQVNSPIRQLASFDQVCTQEWLLEETERRWKDDAEDVWRAMMDPAPFCLRVNLRRTTREKVLDILHEEGINCEEGKLSDAAIVVNQRINLTQHPLYKDGFIEIQDEGSQMIGLACQVQPGMRVLDACAGAGGKTLQLADLMSDQGAILARDIEMGRLKEVPKRAFRSGVSIITTERVSLGVDKGRTFRKRKNAPETTNEPRQASPENFDVVLIDAPCSGTGTARRQPMVKWRLSPDQANRHAKKQFKLLKENAPLVKEGGVLVYSTCSILPIENEDVVKMFLEKHENFTLEEQRQLDPYHNGTDGLFFARLRRTS